MCDSPKSKPADSTDEDETPLSPIVGYPINFDELGDTSTSSDEDPEDVEYVRIINERLRLITNVQLEPGSPRTEKRKRIRKKLYKARKKAAKIGLLKRQKLCSDEDVQNGIKVTTETEASIASSQSNKQKQDVEISIPSSQSDKQKQAVGISIPSSQLDKQKQAVRISIPSSQSDKLKQAAGISIPSSQSDKQKQAVGISIPSSQSDKQKQAVRISIPSSQSDMRKQAVGISITSKAIEKPELTLVDGKRQDIIPIKWHITDSTNRHISLTFTNTKKDVGVLIPESSKQLESTMHDNQPQPVNFAKPNPVTLPLPGFTTASGKFVSVSKKALEFASRMYKSIECSDDTPIVKADPPGFNKMASKKFIPVSKNAIQKASALYQGTEIEPQPREEVVKKKFQPPGFKTANGKFVPVSKTSLKAVTTVDAKNTTPMKKGNGGGGEMTQEINDCIMAFLADDDECNDFA